MNKKTVVIQKEIEGVVYDLMFKTTAANVTLEDGTTADAKLAELSSHISEIITENVIDSKIETSANTLYNKIMGISGSDVTINEAYDTIKEIADWLANTDNETAATIVQDIATLQSKVDVLEKQATKVTDSETNGNIIVDGNEVTVYEHPETHEAAMIVESDDKQFVSKTEKETWGEKTLITVGEEAPESMGTNDLFFKTVSEVTVDITCVNGTASKTSATLDIGSSIYVEFTPDEGYEGATITVNGVAFEDYTTDYTGKVAVLINNVSEDMTVEVVFSQPTTEE